MVSEEAAIHHILLRAQKTHVWGGSQLFFSCSGYPAVVCSKLILREIATPVVRHYCVVALANVAHSWAPCTDPQAWHPKTQQHDSCAYNISGTLLGTNYQ